MPRYVGRDANGKVVDERVTVLMDSKRRQWPDSVRLTILAASPLAIDAWEAVTE